MRTLKKDGKGATLTRSRFPAKFAGVGLRKSNRAINCFRTRGKNPTQIFLLV